MEILRCGPKRHVAQCASRKLNNEKKSGAHLCLFYFLMDSRLTVRRTVNTRLVSRGMTALSRTVTVSWCTGVVS